jgi:hypothetical protein
MTKTIKVAPEVLKFCGVKASKAADLTLEDAEHLMNWCNCQTASLWDNMSLQEILNIYRSTAEYETFEGWADEDWKSAYKAWNRAVINPGNKMRPRP